MAIYLHLLRFTVQMFRFIDFSKLFWSATISQKCTKECSLKYQSFKRVTSEAKVRQA